MTMRDVNADVDRALASGSARMEAMRDARAFARVSGCRRLHRARERERERRRAGRGDDGARSKGGDKARERSRE